MKEIKIEEVKNLTIKDIILMYDKDKLEDYKPYLESKEKSKSNSRNK